MEKIWLLALLLCGCVAAPMMTQERFETIQVGSSFSIVENEFGAPYDVVELQDGSFEYRYIQRYNVGPNSSEQIHYIYRVYQGKIICKNIQRMNSPWDIRTP